MDTTKANIKNTDDILLEFETLDEERYAVSILEEIKFQKKLKEVISEAMISLIPKENSRHFILFNSQSGVDMIHEAIMERLVIIDINKIQD